MANMNEMMINSIRNREPLSEPLIGLRSLLKAQGTEGYIKLCAKRISESKLIDGIAIIVDLSDPFNLLMTCEGMKSAFDIIKGYCDENNLKDYIKALDNTRQYFNKINEHAAYFRLLNNSILRDMKKKKNLNNSLSPEEINEISVFAAEELKARKMHNKLIRFFVNIANRVNYHAPKGT